MCQILTKRLTKHVSLCVFVSLFSIPTLSAFAQEEPQGLADEPEITVEVSAPEEATTEQDTAEQEVAAQETADPETVDDVATSDNKLEEIDEASVTYEDEGSDGAEVEEETTATPLSEEVEDLKKAALELNRDLLILEEELLFPANSQIVVFLSLDIGEYFSLDSVKVMIDDKLVASHLYTKRQNTALSLGGIQRLYLGNLKSGDHEVTAFFVGVGPNNREYKRGATIVIEKDDDPKLLELKVRDSTANMQPEFEFEEWLL